MGPFGEQNLSLLGWDKFKAIVWKGHCGTTCGVSVTEGLVLAGTLDMPVRFRASLGTAQRAMAAGGCWSLVLSLLKLLVSFWELVSPSLPGV